MPKSVSKKTGDGAVFQCRVPHAEAVFLAGTFNDWDPEATPMERAVDGTWSARLELPPGRYEYKFVVDGCWCCDADDDEESLRDCVPNPFGSMNRVVDVPINDRIVADPL